MKDETHSSDETLSNRADPARPPGSRYRPTGVMLGKGGLGQVDLLHDRDLGRDVARKELLSDGPAQRERFLREARVTAQLEHPGIVPVYELGQGPDGRPFYTMRRIRGRTLGAVLLDCKGVQDRLALLPAYVAACQAVAYAHSQGVLHRDLKPENMMIGEFGETLVVDWGLAKVNEPGNVQTALTGAYPTVVPEGGHLTRMGATMGTPAYMSPEQARGEPADARSDVWSLGVILFEILAGRRLLEGTGDQMILVLQSHRVGSVSQALAHAPPELIAVVNRALEPWPKRRYRDAGALAADVIRWQNGGLVDAYRYTPREILVRTLRRNSSILVVIGVMVAAAGLLVAGGVASYLGIVAERDRAVVAESVAADREVEANHRLSRSMAKAAVDALKSRDLLSSRILALGSLDIAESPDARGALVATSGKLPELVGTLHLPSPCDMPMLATGGAFACWTGDGVMLWPRLIAAPSTVVIPGAPGNSWTMAASPNGRRYLAIHYDGSVYLVERGAPDARKLDPTHVNSGAFLDDDHVVLASENQLVTVNLATGKTRASSREAVVRYDDLAVLQDGTLLVGSVVDPVSRWDPKTDRWTRMEGDLVAPMLAASADGRVIVAAGGWGGSATPLHLIENGVSRDLEGAVARTMIGISSDGTRVIAATEEKVTIWDGPDWELRAIIPADAMVLGASLAADGETALVTESDGDLRLWQLPPRVGHQPRDTGGTMWDVDPTSDGKLLASAGNDGVLRVADTETGEIIREIALDSGGLGFMTTFGHDAIVAANTRGLVRIGLEDLAIRWELPTDWVANDVAALPDGDFVVATVEGYVLRISSDGKEKWRKKVAEWVSSISMTADGAIAVPGPDTVYRLDPADGRELGRIKTENAEMVVAAPDGSLYIGASGHVGHLDAAGKDLGALKGQHQTKVHLVALRDGTIASADDIGRVCIWNPAGVAQACWPAHHGTVWGTAFVPGKEKLATCGADGAARVWDLTSVTAPVKRLLEDAQRRYGLVPGDGNVVEVVP